ncbi:hypothetical protein HPB48_016960 [Haemaphysalis longicornis]|uniref:poly(A)-specific ribonuclease n=1 Tax=Haemaphysalis longicornis TaxID=44386 RepID=A0A9J6FB25_HAELO|nr:hypothetical protein HPB48_016960 [Haemaphysalis longicornis]
MASWNAAGMNAASSIDDGSSVHEAPNEAPGIRNVWAFNLHEEPRNTGCIIKRYNYVAMDTEFPGVTSNFLTDCASRGEYDYHNLRCNVNMMKVIQIGFTFMDEAAKKP